MVDLFVDDVLKVSLSYNMTNTFHVYDEHTSLVPAYMDSNGELTIMGRSCTVKHKMKSVIYTVKVKLRKVPKHAKTCYLFYSLVGTTVPSIDNLNSIKLSVSKDKSKDVQTIDVDANVLSRHFAHLLTLTRSIDGWKIEYVNVPFDGTFSGYINKV